MLYIKHLRFIFIFLFAVLFSGFSVDAVSQDIGLPVSAKGAVMISADTNNVIYEKNSNEKLSMASTTKIMTGLLALEKVQKDGDFLMEITEEMVMVEGSSMGLRAGDKLMMSDVVSGLMLASGNDAANSLAIAIAGTQEAFAELMNAKAAEIGMVNTNFVTPSGLDDEVHHSTAYDMAILTREAMKNEIFREIVSSKTRSVNFINPEKTVRYSNHNKLLSLYENCIGVKTGFTEKSGRCLVSAAERDGVTLIMVTLNADDDWNDHIAMFDYGFSKIKNISFNETDFFAEINIVGSDSSIIKVSGIDGGEKSLLDIDTDEIERVVYLPKFVYAPVKNGDMIGVVKYYMNDSEFLSVPIIAQEAAAHKFVKKESFWDKILNKFKN